MRVENAADPLLGKGSERADDGIRTRDPHLGKVMLYQLSHVRVPALTYRAVDSNSPSRTGNPG
jgi:hypothetical protein